MKIKITRESIQVLLKVVLFVCTTGLIAQFFPRQSTFKYNFQIGKPWPYSLLTAPFDFPIHKTKEQLRAEEDSLLHRFAPYYRLDTAIASDQIEKMTATMLNDTFLLRQEPLYKNYLVSRLNNIYEKGIISSAEFEEIQNRSKELHIIKDQLSSKKNIRDVFTERTAYEYLLRNASSVLSEDILQAVNLNDYITTNLFYNKEFSEQTKNEMLKNMSLTVGMMQKDEKIIDRGEKVDFHTHQLLYSLRIETEKLEGKRAAFDFVFLGQLMLIISLLALLFLYLYLFREKIFQSNKQATFILMMILLMIIFASLIKTYTNLSIYIVPFALSPIIIRTFFDSRTALFAHIITILQVSLMADDPYQFIFLQLTVGMTTVSSLKDLTQRSQLVQTAMLIFATYVIMFLGFSLVLDGNLLNLDWLMFLYFGINALLLLFAYGLIYIFEKTFGFLSNVTLVELSNVNTPLLLKFSETAPGSFQHSMQVANLATEAARKINANVLLLRTGALYHDIGKMKNPMYFTENQPNNSANPLSGLPLEEAAECIIDHVKDGVEIAEKYNLPPMIIDFIRTHHGDGHARYFYNLFINKFPDKPIHEEAFTYPGPRPFTKELALLMMADAVEAASRSLPEHTDLAINNLVEKIITGQISEGLFKNAPINFRDVEVVKSLFKEKLKTIYHVRISYPEVK